MCQLIHCIFLKVIVENSRLNIYQCIVHVTCYTQFLSRAKGVHFQGKRFKTGKRLVSGVCSGVTHGTRAELHRKTVQEHRTQV